MRRKKHTPIFVRKCDHCGTELQTNEPGSDSYVITAAHPNILQDTLCR